jgi:hypothetical protein
MSLRQNSRRALRKHRKQQDRKQKVQGRPAGIGHNQGPQLSPLPAVMHDNQVLSFRQWCQFNNISQRTGRRLIASGEGPTVTRLSTKRIGISVGNNAAWQAARARA